MLTMSRRLVVVALLSGVVFGAIGCGSKERAVVEIQYALNPSNERYGTNLRLADRKHTSTVMKEADLAAAGLMASAAPGKAAQLLDVQGVVMAEINVKVEKHKGKGTTISSLWGGGGGGHGWGSGHGGASTREVEKESRHITVQTDFKLVDAATSENWVTHSPRPYRRTDKTKVSPFFGSAKTEEAMTPRDEIIGAAVEIGARQFVAKIIPCTVRYEVELRSSGQENCAKGVAYLRGDMPEEALAQLKIALVEDPDDHRAAFAAGVTCEMMGRYDEALKYYKQACVLENEPEYLEARKRMSENLDRIRTGETA